MFEKTLVIIRPLTGAMLEQIKQRRLSDIICENTDIETLTENVFTQVEFMKTKDFSRNRVDLVLFSRGLPIQKWNALPIGNLTWKPWHHSCKQKFDK